MEIILFLVKVILLRKENTIITLICLFSPIKNKNNAIHTRVNYQCELDITIVYKYTETNYHFAIKMRLNLLFLCDLWCTV